MRCLVRGFTLASPSELSASPSELLASPSELLASPSELSASPSELLASPSELSSVTQRALSVTQRAHLSVWFPSPRPPLRRDGDWWVVHAPPLLLRMRASMLGRVLAWLQDFEQAM
jgi:hypothetical protein